jgi:hypothetical protein
MRVDGVGCRFDALVGGMVLLHVARRSRRATSGLRSIVLLP